MVYRAYCLMIFTLLAISTCAGQPVSLSLDAGAASPGRTVSLGLNLSSPVFDPPVSVEWTLSYSTNDFSVLQISSGPAATAANKQLSCTYGANTATCLVWGFNVTPIADGVVANVALTLSSSTASTSSPVEIGNVAVASAGAAVLPTTVNSSVVGILQPNSFGSLSCKSQSITPLGSVSCLVILTSLPQNTAKITLSASPPVAELPGTIVIPTGATLGTFTVTARAIKTPAFATLTASYLGRSTSIGLAVIETERAGCEGNCGHR
jgi:hypothetical protein